MNLKSTFSRSFVVGCLLVLMYNVLNTIQGVYLANLFQRKSVFASLVFNFGLLYIVFICIFIFSKTMEQKRQELTRISKKHIFFINILTVFMWATYYFALKYIEPAIQAAISCAVPTIVTFTYLVITANKKLSTYEKITLSGLLVGALFLIFASFLGLTGLPFNFTSACFGIAMAILCGLSIGIYSILSKEISKSGISVVTIMCLRFPLLLVLASLLVPKGDFSYILTGSELPLYILVAVFGTIIPVYCIQKGMFLLQPTQVSLLMSWLPIFFFIHQLSSNRISFSYLSLIGVVCVVSALMILPLSDLYLKKYKW